MKGTRSRPHSYRVKRKLEDKKIIEKQNENNTLVWKGKGGISQNRNNWSVNSPGKLRTICNREMFHEQTEEEGPFCRIRKATETEWKGFREV